MQGVEGFRRLRIIIIRSYFDVLTDGSPVGWKGERTRLFLSDIGYEKALDSQAKGQIKILSHAKVRNGDLFYDHKEQIR